MLRNAFKRPASASPLRALIPLLTFFVASSLLLAGRLELRILPPSGEARFAGPVQVTIEHLASGQKQQHWVQSNAAVSLDLGTGEYQIRVEAEGRQTVLRRLHPSEFAATGPTMLSLAVGSPDSRLLGPEAGRTISIDVLRIPRKALRELEKAEKAQRQEQLQKAIQHLEKAIRIDPDFYQAHNNLGAIYLRLSRPGEARQSLERALHIRPDDPMALRNLAYLQPSGGQFGQAVKSLGRLIHVRPSDCWAFEYRGEALYQLGQTTQAQASFAQALALDSNSSMARYRLGEIAYKRRDFETALAHFRSYLKTDSPQDSIHVEKLVKRLEAVLNGR